MHSFCFLSSSRCNRHTIDAAGCSGKSAYSEFLRFGMTRLKTMRALLVATTAHSCMTAVHHITRGYSRVTPGHDCITRQVVQPRQRPFALLSPSIPTDAVCVFVEQAHPRSLLQWPLVLFYRSFFKFGLAATNPTTTTPLRGSAPLCSTSAYLCSPCVRCFSCASNPLFRTSARLCHRAFLVSTAWRILLARQIRYAHV